MTGEELLMKLQAMSYDQLKTNVAIEGCDCWGFAGNVTFEESDNTISISRLENGHA